MNKSLEIISSYIEQGIFPGCNFSVLDKKGRKDFLFGNQTIIPKIQKLKQGMSWDMASVSKVLGTGQLLIDLYLAREIDLDKEFQDYYPDFHETGLSLRKLLTHTSGLNPFIPNRDSLDKTGLIAAMNQLKLTQNTKFKYTDVNFILLGLMLERYFQQDLDLLLEERVFKPLKMKETRFGPVLDAVATSTEVEVGQVHDPKGRVLGGHCGSAGLFSKLDDLNLFVQHYFENNDYLKLLKNYSQEKEDKRRSLAWDLLDDDWLLHTGYTGTFILMNLKTQQAVIFLSNRVHLRDERQKWIKERDLLIACMIKELNERVDN